MRRVILFYFIFSELAAWRGGGGYAALPDFFSFLFFLFSKALHGRLKSQRDGTGGKLTVDPPFSIRRERGTGKI